MPFLTRREKVSSSRTSKRETACSSPSSQLRLWGYAVRLVPSCHKSFGFTMPLLRSDSPLRRVLDVATSLSGISPLSHQAARFALTHRSGPSCFRHRRPALPNILKLCRPRPAPFLPLSVDHGPASPMSFPQRRAASLPSSPRLGRHVAPSFFCSAPREGNISVVSGRRCCHSPLLSIS